MAPKASDAAGRASLVLTYLHKQHSFVGPYAFARKFTRRFVDP